MKTSHILCLCGEHIFKNIEKKLDIYTIVQYIITEHLNIIYGCNVTNMPHTG